jgi:hypothetical protein
VVSLQEKKMGISADIAELIVKARVEDLDDDVLHWAKVGLIDYTGCTFAIKPGRA